MEYMIYVFVFCHILEHINYVFMFCRILEHINYVFMFCRILEYIIYVFIFCHIPAGWHPGCHLILYVPCSAEPDFDCSLNSAPPRFVRLQYLCKCHVGCCQRAPLVTSLVLLPELLLPPLRLLAHATTCPRTPPVLLLLTRALLWTLDVV